MGKGRRGSKEEMKEKSNKVAKHIVNWLLNFSYWLFLVQSGG